MNVPTVVYKIKTWAHLPSCKLKKGAPSSCRCKGMQAPGSDWCGSSRAFGDGPITYCRRRCRDASRHIEVN